MQRWVAVCQEVLLEVACDEWEVEEIPAINATSLDILHETARR